MKFKNLFYNSKDFFLNSLEAKELPVGGGVYALYYVGDFPAYGVIVDII